MNIQVFTSRLRTIDKILLSMPYNEKLFRLTLTSLAQIGILSNSYDPMRAVHLRKADYLEASTMGNLITQTIERGIKRLLVRQQGLPKNKKFKAARQEIDQGIDSVVSLAGKFGIVISLKQLQKAAILPPVNLDSLQFLDNRLSKPRGNPNRPEWAEERPEHPSGRQGKVLIMPKPQTAQSEENGAQSNSLTSASEPPLAPARPLIDQTNVTELTIKLKARGLIT